MSLTFKLASLAIRTAAKPIGNYIKRNARDHEGFRKFCVNQAQRLHRIDMRMRLGILHDQAAQDRMHTRAQAEAEAKKKAAENPTVRTEAEQKKFDEETTQAEQDAKQGKKKEEKPPKVKIRPLPEAKAIDLGANFFSEAFIFTVAAGLLVWDSWRSKRKETARRDDVAERLESLESELERLKHRYEPDHVPEPKAKDSPAKAWYNPVILWRGTEPNSSMKVEPEHTSARAVDAATVLKPEGLKPRASTAATSFSAETSSRPSGGPVSPTISPEMPARLDTINATKKER